jgi:branched-chain amino acid transport system substrate-binding protein
MTSDNYLAEVRSMSFGPLQLRFRLPTIVLLSVAIAASVVLSACGGNDDESASGNADGPVKIGVLLPYTGPFGLYGKPMEAAIRARFAKAGNKAGTRPVKLVFEDEATDPKVAVSKATKLVEQDKVNAVICCATGGATLAVGPILAEQGIPQLGPIPNPSGLSKYPTAAVAAPTASHDAEELGRYAGSKLGYKTATVVASDFAYGREVAEGFANGFKASGGSVTKQVFVPLGTQDFGSYLTQVGKPDVTFGGFAGADAIGFVQQYRKFGVAAPLIGHGPLVTELVLKAIGPAADGVGAGFYYSSQLKNAANADFISTMKGANAQFVPSHFTAGAWAAGSVLISAIENAGDKATDGKELAKAIRSTNIEAPWGPLKFDQKTGYAIAPTYFYKVVGTGAKIHHDVVGQISG